MAHPRQFVLSLVVIALVLGLVLFGGIGATAFAAQAALPGDALYPVKTGLEDTRVKFASDAGDQAQLHLEYAEIRLNEISSLIQDGRFNEISQATAAFEFHVQQAINALQTVSAGDPVRAGHLASQIIAALAKYQQALTVMMQSVPESVRAAVQQAIQASQNAGINPLMHNDDLNNNENTNGFEDNGNTNINENENEQGNENINLNENENENEDLNQNSNLNQNLNSNSNLNENQNDQLNENDEHHDNTNLNSNQNTNDNHQENENHNTNLNDNSHDDDNHNTNGGD